MGSLSFRIRVTPGASRDNAEGRYGEGDILRVRVRAPAVDGRANDAVQRLLAAVLGVPKRDVAITAGGSGRTKLVTVNGDDLYLRRRLAQILDPGPTEQAALAAKGFGLGSRVKAQPAPDPGSPKE